MGNHKITQIMATIVISLFMLAIGTQESEIYTESASAVSGTVVDANTGEGIQSASVTFEELGETTTTDEYGEFSFSDIEVGTYTVSVEANGYSTSSVDVVVSEDGATVEVELEPEYN
jgi:iron complex outermembrane recepter protein